MCLWAHATTSAIHVRLILPGECHGRLPARLCHTSLYRIWPFSALVDNSWKWCAGCWRKIAFSLVDRVVSAIAWLHQLSLPYDLGRSPANDYRDLPPFFAHGIMRHFLHSGLRLRT